MRHSIITLLQAVVIILAFVGQSYANNAMSCAMLMQGNMQHSMTMPSAEHHQMMTAETSDIHIADMSEQDCCQVECTCPASVCSSLSISSIDIQWQQTKALSGKIYLPELNHTSLAQKSLYRPPIQA